ncbi:MAG: DUF655 domain-containing protein [Candidatus Hodarchaeota archaeon]
MRSVRRPEKRKKYEEFAYVLDFLPDGYPSDPRSRHQREPIIQAIGESFFTLLELIVKRNQSLQPLDRIKIGRGGRNVVNHVKKRLKVNDLTFTAKSELSNVIKIILAKREADIIDFFNSAVPITPRMHQLELLPGIGKKHMWRIIEERKKAPFVNYSDLSKRCSISDPQKIIWRRILSELERNEKYRLFTRPE